MSALPFLIEYGGVIWRVLAGGAVVGAIAGRRAIGVSRARRADQNIR